MTVISVARRDLGDARGLQVRSGEQAQVGSGLGRPGATEPRHLAALSAASLPLIALVPGAPEAFGLPRWLLMVACVCFAAVHGTDWVFPAAKLDGRRGLMRLELLGWCGFAVVARGDAPMVWAYVYFAVAFAALRFGRDEQTAGALCLACVGANLMRTPVDRALPSAALAHSVAPTLLYWLLGRYEDQARQERARVASLVAAEADARTRRLRVELARDVHDGTGALLAGAALQADLAREAYALDPTLAARAARRAATLTARAALEVPALSQHPPSSWEEACARLGEMAALIEPSARCHWQVLPGAPPPSLGAWRALRRICSEAVGNCSRHARARTVTVDVGVLQGRVELSVVDDGMGMSRSAVGFGQRSIREQAAELGGRAEWIATEAGTTLRVVLPLDGGDAA
ncbi:MAG: hypothetical protein HYZ29_12735 [Myxococcales bacterium]|nr:hypothetical protein [Myxococcales bacterium]